MMMLIHKVTKKFKNAYFAKNVFIQGVSEKM